MKRNLSSKVQSAEKSLLEMFNQNVVTLCLLTISSFSSLSCAIFTSGKAEERLLGSVVAATNGAEARRHLISVASIRSKYTHGNFHVCGGFIINKHWVGTAAQCMIDKTINNTAVAVGSTNIAGGTIYDLNRIEIHNYNVNTAIIINFLFIKRNFI